MKSKYEDMNHDKIISYLAGLFDGEGSFSIQVHIRSYGFENKFYVNIGPKMTMSLRDGHEVLELLQQTFGGQIYKYKDETWRWNLSKKQSILNAVEELLPYLRIKKQIAEQFIEGVKLIPGMQDRKGRQRRRLTEETAIKLAEIALSLNPESARRTIELLPKKLEKIKEVYKI